MSILASMILSLALAHAGETDLELERSLQLLAELDRISLGVDYDAEPLDRVIADLDDRLPMPVRADWQALKRLGVDEDDGITLRLPNSSVTTVLGALALAVGDEFERPMFEVHAGQIVFTTVAATQAMRLTDVYDVRDLLADVELVDRLRREAPVIETSEESTKLAGGADADRNPSDPAGNPAAGDAEAESPQEKPRDPDPPGSPDLPGDPPGAAPPSPPAALGFAKLPQLKSIDEIIDPDAPIRERTPGEELLLLISDHIDPEAWIDFGGDRARISERGSGTGVLLVTAPPTTHRKFREALRRLRAVNPQSLAVEAVLIDLPRSTVERLSRQHNAGSDALAAALQRDPSAIRLWRSSSAVALGSRSDVESSAADIAIHIVLSTTLDKERGVLRIAIEAGTSMNDDQRQVNTEIALTSDQSSTVIDLPPAKPSETVRLLVLTVRRN